MATVQDIKDRVTAMQVEVENNSTVTASVVALIQATAAQIADLKQQLADAIASGNPVELQAVVEGLNTLNVSLASNDQALAAAVLAGTPPVV